MIQRAVDKEDSAPFVVPDVILSVVVPAWNEGWCITNTLTTLARVLQSIPGVEIIIVDDGSTDDTADQARRWVDRDTGVKAEVISLATNCGKGRAVVEGIRRARGHFVAYIDADLDIPAEELLGLYNIAQEFPGSVLVGSKQQQDQRQRAGLTLLRRVISRTFAFLVSRVFCLPIRDTQTGLKIYPGAVARRIARDVTLSGYLFDVELLILAHLCRVQMQEVPIRYTPRRQVNRIGIRHLFRSMLELAILYRRYGYQTRKGVHDIHYAHFDA